MAGTMDSFLQTFRLNSDLLNYSTISIKLVYWWEIYGRVQINWHHEVSSEFIWTIIITPLNVFFSF
jgi:hypothetical protein